MSLVARIPPTSMSAQGNTGALPVLYGDESVLVIDKPAGMLSVPGRGPGHAPSAICLAQARWPDALTVHRLDMATSGLLLIARGALAQRRLSSRFAAREVVKHYEALVTGVIGADSGEIDLPLCADWPNRPRQQVDALNGKPSLTRFRVLSRDLSRQHTRLELQPVTGRSHQLRVHLMAIGHPIVGDELYGHAAGDAGGAGDADAARGIDSAGPCPVAGPPTASRLMLHATRLVFVHPHSGVTMSMHSAAPFADVHGPVRHCAGEMSCAATNLLEPTS
jgi:tRNA pseudouridine32 synthase/23S rRNA pseudouridine746 synthase